MARDEIRARVVELAPWYQYIELEPGLWTKDLTGNRDIFAEADIPGPLWRLIARDLLEITGARVLDIGCNAGYMSFEAKRPGRRPRAGDRLQSRRAHLVHRAGGVLPRRARPGG